MNKPIFFKHTSFKLGLVLIILVVPFVFFYAPTWLGLWHLHSVLVSPSWNEYQDKILGISFQYPSNWYAPKMLNKSALSFGNSYGLFFSGDFVDITITKVEDMVILDNLQKNEKYEKEKVKINGIEFTIFHNRYFFKDEGLKTEGFFYAADRNLLIYIQNGQTTDESLWERQQADKIISKIVYSIKGI